MSTELAVRKRTTDQKAGLFTDDLLTRELEPAELEQGILAVLDKAKGLVNYDEAMQEPDRRGPWVTLHQVVTSPTQSYNTYVRYSEYKDSHGKAARELSVSQVPPSEKFDADNYEPFTISVNVRWTENSRRAERLWRVLRNRLIPGRPGGVLGQERMSIHTQFLNRAITRKYKGQGVPYCHIGGATIYAWQNRLALGVANSTLDVIAAMGQDNPGLPQPAKRLAPAQA